MRTWKDTDVIDVASMNDIESQFDNLRLDLRGVTQTLEEAALETDNNRLVLKNAIQENNMRFKSLERTITQKDTDTVEILSQIGLKQDFDRDGIFFEYLDGCAYAISGTKESDTNTPSFANIIYGLPYTSTNKPGSVPAPFTPGNTYILDYISKTVKCVIWFYKGDTYLNGFEVKTSRTFTIPTDATGMLVRLQVDVPQGYEYTTAEIVHPKIYQLGVLPNQKKMLTYGDSVFYGQIWADNPEDSSNALMYRTLEGYRIPDRVAAAVHCADYTNYAVGGMKYCAKGTNIGKIFNKIQDTAEDIATADLIVLGGGRNDANYNLGTAEAAKALTFNWINADTASTLSEDAADENNTICNRIAECLSYIRYINPTCQVVVVSVTPWSEVPGDAYTFKSGNASSATGHWTLAEWDIEVKALCDYYNAGYVSWKNCSLIYNWSKLSGAAGNYAHMKDQQSYVQLGNYLAGQVSKYYLN